MMTSDVKHVGNIMADSDNGVEYTIFEGVECDDTRFITLRAPYILTGVDAECNESQRWSHGWYGPLPTILEPIESSINNIVIDGLQFDTEDDIPIYISGGSNVSVTNNIIQGYECLL